MIPYHTREESECLQVLQDVAVLGGDEDHVEFLQRLVHIANTVRFHKGVLLARVHQFRECSQETLDTCPGHFHKLPRYNGLAGLGAHRRCQQHLQAKRVNYCVYRPLVLTQQSFIIYPSVEKVAKRQKYFVGLNEFNNVQIKLTVPLYTLTSGYYRFH